MMVASPPSLSSDCTLSLLMQFAKVLTPENWNLLQPYHVRTILDNPITIVSVPGGGGHSHMSHAVNCILKVPVMSLLTGSSPTHSTPTPAPSCSGATPTTTSTSPSTSTTPSSPGLTNSKIQLQFSEWKKSLFKFLHDVAWNEITFYSWWSQEV